MTGLSGGSPSPRQLRRASCFVNMSKQCFVVVALDRCAACSDFTTLHDFSGGWAWCVREPVDRHGSSHTRGFVLYCIVHMPKQCFVLSWLFIAALLAATWQRCMIFRGDGQGVFASMSTGMVLLTPEASFYAA